MRILKGTILCLCALLALSAAPALAKKKKKPAKLGPVTTVTAAGNTATVSGNLSSATATCPSGTVAVGGGFTTIANNPTTISSPVDNYRVGSQQWTVNSVIGGFGPVNGSINAIAYCRHSNRAISDATGSGATAPGTLGSGSASATCPAGQKLIAGGFQSGQGATAQVAIIEQSSSPQAGVWSVAGINNGTTSRPITAHAYCMPGLKPKLLVGTASGAPAQGGSVAVTSAACPKAKKSKKKKKKPQLRLSAGGFSSPLGTSMSGSVALFEESHISGSGWFVRAINAGVTASMSVTSQGICA